MDVMFLFFVLLAFFSESHCPWTGECLCSDIRQALLLFRTKVPVVMPTTSNFVYFSFLPVKQRDFPGNVRSGGRDSLPLVVAFTSKQHESPLSYALHFLHIISHRMCCAGERAQGRAGRSVKKYLRLPGKKARKVRALSDLTLSGRRGPRVCFVPLN